MCIRDRCRHMTNITYKTTTNGISEEGLSGGFFEDWLNPPSPPTHLRILEGADHIVLADHQDRGIGYSLMNQMMDEIGDIYMIDLVCDANLSRFYAELGFATTTG